ncbi:MAG: hypothetical protein P8J00_08170 [Yoonia sp.]|nr:hypothetical protein [Yoonia sp.]
MPDIRLSKLCRIAPVSPMGGWVIVTVTFGSPAMSANYALVPNPMPSTAGTRRLTETKSGSSSIKWMVPATVSGAGAMPIVGGAQITPASNDIRSGPKSAKAAAGISHKRKMRYIFMGAS